jgi:hypothetical protein
MGKKEMTEVFYVNLCVQEDIEPNADPVWYDIDNVGPDFHSDVVYSCPFLNPNVTALADCTDLD